jgi:CheY-like chemotaxis protein
LKTENKDFMDNILTQKYRLLLVEDNDVNRQMAKRLLERMGYDVEVACDGEEAVALLSITNYDLVLMDCQMPVMDGFEATRAIRQQHNNTPIIAMTGNAMNGDKENCLAVGMNDYVMKPIDRMILSETIKKWLPDSTNR